MAKRADGVKRELWTKRLGKFDRSKLTVAEFCLREQVSQASFYYWSKRLRQCGPQLAQQNPVTGIAAVSLPEDADRRHAFRPPFTDSGFVEIVVGDSIRVRFPMGRLHDVVAFVKQLQDASRDATDLMEDGRFQRVQWASSATPS